ncbi:Hsp70 family protein [Massilia sp. UMI-21]|nr:Hsp70 family protein [Massilia sp. UMI-21]
MENAPQSARFAIGIDLGTTHSALSYVDLQASDGEKTVDGVLPVPQLSGPGTVEALPLLPSFLYLPHPDELAPGETALPWSAGGEGFIAGEMARSRGATTPIRLVSSAKSWLSHPSVDRRAAILPHDAPEEVARVSPLEASTRYLAHLRQAWNAAHPDAPFDQQQVTVTIPASFDPGARELTAEAARHAGFQPTLLEEPQAALYSWIQGSGGAWRKQVKAGDIVLVVDVGGGTSDFSLIAILERDGKLEPHRVAVGDHILLGGDNMDLALAHFVARKLQANGTQLDSWQMRALTYGCRSAKEHLLADANATVWPIVVPSRGSKLIGGSIRTELTRDEVTAFITDGFFPRVEASARPATRQRAGLTQVGLPYAQDAAITKHLAAFLARQAGATAELEGFAGQVNAEHRDGAPSFLHPSAVLFNGGVFKSSILAQRVMDTINDWLYMEGAEPARVLEGADLDLAVARGAAYFSYARRGGGVRIRGGTARSYYVGVESSMPAIPGMEPPIEALCVAPFGMEEGSELELPGQEFGLVVGEPVTFRFFGSTTRRQDRIGEVLEFWGPDELQEMNEIQATLPAEGRIAGDVVQVKLHALATDAGTLELAAVARDGQRWKIEFDVRNAPDQH